MDNPLEGLLEGEEIEITCEGIGNVVGVVDRIENDSIYFKEIVFGGIRKVKGAQMYFFSQSYGIKSITQAENILYLNKAVEGIFKHGEISSEWERNKIRDQAEFFIDNIK